MFILEANFKFQPWHEFISPNFRSDWAPTCRGKGWEVLGCAGSPKCNFGAQSQCSLGKMGQWVGRGLLSKSLGLENVLVRIRGPSLSFANQPPPSEDLQPLRSLISLVQIFLSALAAVVCHSSHSAHHFFVFLKECFFANHSSPTKIMSQEQEILDILREDLYINEVSSFVLIFFHTFMPFFASQKLRKNYCSF